MAIKGNITLLILLVRCPQPPFYLFEGQILTHAIPIPAEASVDGKAPKVYWVEVVGEDKPSLACKLTHGSGYLHMEGLLDTGADVAIIPERMWLSHWGLKPMAGKIQGVGGIKLAKISKLIVQIEGLDGSKTITKPQELIAQLIQKARMRLCELVGCDFTCIHLSVKLSEEGRNSPERVTKEMFEHLLQRNSSLQLSLDSYSGQISVHALSHKLFNEEFHLIFCEKKNPETTQNSHSVHGLVRGIPQGNDDLEKSPDSALGSRTCRSGGPCTFGRLSLLAPNKTLIGEWTHKNKSAIKIQKRSADNLDLNCDSEILQSAKSKRIAVYLFLPLVAPAKALGQLGHLECRVVKQANLTSTAISSLLEDEEIIRQATLQNCAAIDFLLLLHEHEGQEFEGLCCINLTSKARNIHAAL
ncbi:hypothetical protein TURU_081913 [Turdus rufiventris]|nr:hypothetical protein TURU_081913 [Turdus rufiventris]